MNVLFPSFYDKLNINVFCIFNMNYTFGLVNIIYFVFNFTEVTFGKIQLVENVNVAKNMLVPHLILHREHLQNFQRKVHYYPTMNEFLKMNEFDLFMFKML